MIEGSDTYEFADSIFTIDSKSSQCGGVSGVLVGVLDSGTYKITYSSGAARTNSSFNWNQRASDDSGCGCSPTTWNFDIGYGSTIIHLPGTSLVGWGTASEAEVANIGSSIDLVLTSTQIVYAWYCDSNSSDNEGIVTYTVNKIF